MDTQQECEGMDTQQECEGVEGVVRTSRNPANVVRGRQRRCRVVISWGGGGDGEIGRYRSGDRKQTHDTSLVNLLSSWIFILIHQVLTSAPSPIQSDIPCSDSPP